MSQIWQKKEDPGLVRYIEISSGFDRSGLKTLERIVDPNRHFGTGTPIRYITGTSTYLRDIPEDFNMFRMIFIPRS